MRLVLSLVFALLAAGPALAQLSGTYTVPGDYATLGAAVDDLNTQGVSGPVRIEIARGTYPVVQTIALALDEQGPNNDGVNGTSAVNRVTITSASGDPADVGLTWTGASSGVTLDVRGAFLTVQALSFESAATLGRLTFEGRGIEILNNALTGIPFAAQRAITGVSNGIGGVTVSDNVITDYLGGLSVGVRTAIRGSEDGVVVERNTIRVGFDIGISIGSADGPIIRDNDVIAGDQGLYLRRVTGAARVERNRIEGQNEGILSIESGSATARIANNLVRSRVQALGMSAGTWQVWHNTLVTHGVSGSGVRLFSGRVDLRNNVIETRGGVGAHYHSTGPTGQSDYNAYFTNGGPVGRINATTYAGLDAFSAALTAQNGAPTDANSLAVDPQFVDPGTTVPGTGDYTPQSAALDATAAPVLVTDDLDGADRSTVTPVDLGAIAFVSPFAPLAAGTYSIPSDFATLADAVNALNAGGVTGAVTFELAAGTYADRVEIGAIAGASATDRVTVRSASGDPADVMLSPTAATGASDAFVIRLQGTSHVTIAGVSFATSGGFPRAVQFAGGVSDIEIRGNAFIADAATTGRPDAAAISGSQIGADGLVIADNEITGFGYGVYVLGLASNPATGIEVSGNTLDVGVDGIYLNRAHAPIVTDNRAVGDRNGMYLANLSGPTQVLRNRVEGGRTYGLAIFNSGGAEGAEAEVSNNVAVGSNIGLLVSRTDPDARSDHWRIWHNTAVHTGSTGAAFALTSATGVDVRNNLFVSQGAGAAYSVVTPQVEFVSDYNALYTTGPSLGRIQTTDYPDLASFVAALDAETRSNPDANSVSADPAFDASASQPYTPNAAALDATSAPALASVDVNGADRSSLTPVDLGAVAFEAFSTAAEAAPTAFALDTPFPNPTTSGATVTFDVAEASEVTVEVLDLLGRRAAVLAQGAMPAGRHRAEVPRALAAGAYIVRMRAGAFEATARLAVVR